MSGTSSRVWLMCLNAAAMSSSGMRAREISEVLGVSVGRVRQLLAIYKRKAFFGRKDEIDNFLAGIDKRFGAVATVPDRTN